VGQVKDRTSRQAKFNEYKLKVQKESRQ
ncbi:MAG: hypothetical protein K0S29_1096, partial [Gammaproteobacteria bacterium]|nr:hypothetical protein [Gammaproteobacteria bacterium]